MNGMSKLTLILAMVLFACSNHADWQIVEVNTKPFLRKPFNGPPEIQLNLSIRNISERQMFIWGQNFGGENNFYLMESLIKDADNGTWERHNVGMCGSVGKIGWIRVNPCETISVTKVLFEKYVGRQMILTFRRAYSEGDDKGSEIFLEPFKIPEAKNSDRFPRGDSLEAAGFTEEVLTHAFESGRALVVVRVSSVREEKDKNNTVFYYYRTHILRSIIDGDFITKNLNDPLELFAGASYGEALTPGSEYALFIIQRGPHYFLWAHRDAVLKVDSPQSKKIADLSKKASQVYEATNIFGFRKPAIVVSLLPELPEQLLSLCEKFRRNPDIRVRFAKAIAESDIASKPKYQLPSGIIPSSKAEHKKPIVRLTRSQVIELLGEPTLKSGRNYLWYCGRDSSIDQPGKWVGVLSLVFDSDANVSVLRYLLQDEWKWRKDY